jgi:hypothetical protein
MSMAPQKKCTGLTLPVSVLGVDEELVEGRLVGGDSVCEGLAEARLEARAGVLRVHGQERPNGRSVIDHHTRQLPLRGTIGDLRPPACLQKAVVAADVEALELGARPPLDAKPGDVGLRRPDVASKRHVLAIGDGDDGLRVTRPSRVGVPEGVDGMNWRGDCIGAWSASSTRISIFTSCLLISLWKVTPRWA